MKNNRTVSWHLRKAAWVVTAWLPTKWNYSYNRQPSCIWRRSHSIWVLVSLFPGTAKVPPQDRPHRCMYRHEENTQVVVRCLLALPLLLVADIDLAFHDVTALVTDDYLSKSNLEQLCRYVRKPAIWPQQGLRLYRYCQDTVEMSVTCLWLLLPRWDRHCGNTVTMSVTGAAKVYLGLGLRQ